MRAQPTGLASFLTLLAVSGMKGIATLLLATAALAAMAGEARAGYAHYFTWNGRIDENQLKACVADMGRIIAAARNLVAGPDGAGSPVIDPLKIEFNGRGDSAHEPFIFPGNHGSNFCKTQFKPYDAVVTACLIAARDHFPSTSLTIASDGQWDDGDWADGARLYERALGRKPADPTSALDEPQPEPDQPPIPNQPPEWGPLDKVIVIALAVGLIWWLTRPRWAFSIFVERDKIDRVRGYAPRMFLLEVDDICRQFVIPKGTIRALQVGNWIRLIFSPGFPPDCRQRIRNAWTADLS